MSIDHNFESRMLYTQECHADENTRVKSSVYAVSYNYPGSLSTISARCRLTLVYTAEAINTDVIAHGGTIEKWSDRGWHVVDEYFDSFIAFDSAEEGLEFMLSMFKSFTLGAPMKLIPIDKTITPSGPPKPDKVPKIRVLNFTKEKEKKDDKNKKNNEPDDDDPDIDWI